MKLFTVPLLISLLSLPSFAQTNYEWRATLKVVDEVGAPIGGANVDIGYYTNSQPANVLGTTDTNGTFSASHSALSSLAEVSFQAEKAGYYPSWVRRELGPEYSVSQWIFTQNLILKQIGKPIAMYAKKVETKVQQEDKPTGFDLVAGDWVTPYGKGFHSDILFTVHRKIVSSHEYDCTLTATFPNKGDGIVIAPSEPDTGSAFRTSRTAAENGYQPELALHYANSNKPEPVFGYFIRIRTELDENGNVKSALYGKISGGFRLYAGTRARHAGMGFNYYLNPTPNDRNMEFDPKHNLVKDLAPLDAIVEP